MCFYADRSFLYNVHWQGRCESKLWQLRQKFRQGRGSTSIGPNCLTQAQRVIPSAGETKISEDAATEDPTLKPTSVTFLQHIGAAVCGIPDTELAADQLLAPRSEDAKLKNRLKLLQFLHATNKRLIVLCFPEHLCFISMQWF